MGIKIHSSDVSPYYAREGGTPAQFGPFRVKLIHDDTPENPWQAWDCQTPLAYGGGRDGVTVHDSGDSILDFFAHVSDSWVSRHWRALCSILDLDPAAHDAHARESVREWGGTLPQTRADCFRAALDEAAPGYYGGTASLYFDTLAALYELAGVPALSTTVQGYSQGDWLAVLLVATPAHAARCGYDPKNPGFDMAESLKGDAELFRAWAFGDCYGYAVEDENGDTVDSCFGYFGAYWDGDENGGGYVLGEAARAVESALEDRVGVCLNAEYAARGDFLDLRREMKREAGKVLGAGVSLIRAGAICAALDRQSRDLLTRWKEAREMRRQCAAALAS